MPTLDIILVDDHPIVRAGFKQLLELEPGWHVIADVGTAQDLAGALLHYRCDVLVLDLSLPDADGLVMIRQLLARSPDMAIVVLTMHDGALFVQDAMAAGARGYVTKRSAPDELIDAIHAVSNDEIYLGRDVRRFGETGAIAGNQQLLSELTAREAQVFLLIARGHSIAKVAATVGLNTKTVYGHRSNIYCKLQIISDHELRLLAEQQGLA
ncbi:MAG: response regulator transcription factor [Pseudomonadota bacterium]|nr:response regulator transcription factor [Pseudomonadota bacterium]